MGLIILCNENRSEFSLGIKPRVPVPVLVDEGDVHIETNDILLHLEEKYPEPLLIPEGRRDEIAGLLEFEDELHLDLRTLNFRALFVPPGPPKGQKDYREIRESRFGTVRGEPDKRKAREVRFWKNCASRGR
ncbi:glutathione S-transferase family protein [Martelella radicis]|uniref:Glutathione S-transferase n=1 Tax=Martelella radicis TaxID=1397476 RepID=A0A7W6KPR3_9HYPH|nr:glutathione S-transferase N-terminal domain-containing protein [Martelella radicis]MBB4123800.1 glutathione S-transferase [Martelella radicis]